VYKSLLVVATAYLVISVLFDSLIGICTGTLLWGMACLSYDINQVRKNNVPQTH